MTVRYGTGTQEFKPKLWYALKIYISALHWYGTVNFTRYGME